MDKPNTRRAFLRMAGIASMGAAGFVLLSLTKSQFAKHPLEWDERTNELKNSIYINDSLLSIYNHGRLIYRKDAGPAPCPGFNLLLANWTLDLNDSRCVIVNYGCWGWELSNP